MAGVPFEPIERLATTGTAMCARELLVRQDALAKARVSAEQFVGSPAHNLSAEESRTLRAALRSGDAPAALSRPQPPEFVSFIECSSRLPAAEAALAETLERELASGRIALLEESRSILPQYLIFGAGGFGERLVRSLAEFQQDRGGSLARNARVRERERRLLLYLQRICAKNDTFAQFGPTAWGTVDAQISGINFAPRDGIAQRESFLERWAAHAVAAALNADPEIRSELAPRLHPHGRLDGAKFIFTDKNESVSLDSPTIELLRRCDGATPAYSLGVSASALEQLAQQNIITWAAEVPAAEPYAFARLVDDVSRWRDTPVRERWQEILRPIANLSEKFSGTDEMAARIEIMEEARARLCDVGATRETSQRFLYAATNPIAEECFREMGFQISESMADELTRDAAPWIDLWRDTYAFVASRVAAGLRALFQTAPVKNGAVPLAAFLKHCEMQKMPLTSNGIVALAHIAFQEVKAAFREQMAARTEAAEWTLTTDDCHFVRRNFDYEKFDEYTYPSADLQISAASVNDVAAGNYEWIVSELHPPIALLHHCFYWSCPDTAALSRALASTTCGRPAFHYGFFAADFTAHTVVRWLDALPQLMNFVAPQRGNPKWNIIPPSEAEVYIDEQNGDVALRKRGSHEYLGSFARSWVIPLGFHPFFFGRAPHMPRLRCGRVIVQRRSWTISHEEFPPGNYTGVSRDLILAVERLRAAKGLPRYIYIRPTEQALRRSGAEGRDKDTKPVFIDLESYLFLEIFHRWLTKSGELEVTEMLPDPDHLLWQEEDGRRTFELRTLIVPRE